MLIIHDLCWFESVLQRTSPGFPLFRPLTSRSASPLISLLETTESPPAESDSLIPPDRFVHAHRLTPRHIPMQPGPFLSLLA